MGIINIQKVQREGARLVIMLCGVSGCGKTKTALELAYGMTGGDGNKIGFLDTENGRGKLYADDYKESPYLYGELKPPVAPGRYVQAIEEFSKAGVEVLVIDSGSHEYEGLGGVIDIAEAGNPKLPNYNKAKAEHKKFMSAMLNSPMHIVLCLRAREKAKPEKNAEGKLVYTDMGLQPITEKNVVFEATASLMLHDQGLRQDALKVPGALAKIMGRGNGYITRADGAALRAWVDGAKQLDPKVEHHRGLLQMAAEKGMAELQKAWGATPPAIKKAISPAGCPEELKASAQAFDQAAAEAASEASNSGSGISAAASALNQAAQAAGHAQDQPPAQTAQGSTPAAGQPDEDDAF